MPTLRFAEARACVLQHVRAWGEVETVATLVADTRVLAENVIADRDYPPVSRSVRDGFAIRSNDRPRDLLVIGEVRAGESFSGTVGPGEAVEIMTGAPMPQGADAVVMVEKVEREGDRIRTDVAVEPGEAVSAKGIESRTGDVLLTRGQRLGFSEIALAASVGRDRLSVYRRPRVAIVPTGDEVVDVGTAPLPYQVRNSNAYSLAAQVKRAGGVPEILPTARDVYDSTRAQIEESLTADLLLLSGGVSAGKYDIVEKVLAELGAEFYFDRVKIQPGQPLVFGKVRERFFFGLPGNPASTMVTFEIFARAAVERLAGVVTPALPLLFARLNEPFHQRPGLVRFLPAWVDDDGNVTPLRWHGSGDIRTLAKSNAFLVTEEDRENWDAGELIRVLLK